MKNKERNRIRHPGMITDFSNRFRLMLSELRFGQKIMAQKLGGFSVQTINCLVRDNAKGIPIDLMVALARFAAAHNISVNWLFAGRGPMKAVDATINDPHLFIESEIRLEIRRILREELKAIVKDTLPY